MVRAEFGGRVSHALLLRQDGRLSTASDAVAEMSRASFQADVRVTMARAIIEKVVADVTAGHVQAIVEQALLRVFCTMLEFAYVLKKGQFDDVMAEVFGARATFIKSADDFKKNVGCPASVSADTLRTSATNQFKQPATAIKSACNSNATTCLGSSASDDVVFFKKENCGQVLPCVLRRHESEVSKVEEISEPLEMIVFRVPAEVIVGNEPTSNHPAPQKGPVHDANGIASLVLTVAKGKEQDDDDEDDDDDDDGDDDDYEEEEEDDNDNKLEAGDDEEDVEGEDEDGDEEAGEEDGEDDGEADDNGEGQDDDGDEDGEEDDDVEGDEDADEDGDEEQEDEEEDGEEDPEDEDEDEVEGESEEDIEDLEPPKKKRK